MVTQDSPKEKTFIETYFCMLNHKVEMQLEKKNENSHHTVSSYLINLNCNSTSNDFFSCYEKKNL